MSHPEPTTEQFYPEDYDDSVFDTLLSPDPWTPIKKPEMVKKCTDPNHWSNSIVFSWCHCQNKKQIKDNNKGI